MRKGIEEEKKPASPRETGKRGKRAGRSQFLRKRGEETRKRREKRRKRGKKEVMTLSLPRLRRGKGKKLWGRRPEGGRVIYLVWPNLRRKNIKERRGNEMPLLLKMYCNGGGERGKEDFGTKVKGKKKKERPLIFNSSIKEGKEKKGECRSRISGKRGEQGSFFS